LPKLNKLYSRKAIDAIRDELIAKYGNQCAICARPKTMFKNRLSVDHNHRSGRVRGLLCYYCNRRRVGQASLESAKAVYEYLLKYDPKGG
jgi:hypothetical protein